MASLPTSQELIVIEESGEDVSQGRTKVASATEGASKGSTEVASSAKGAPRGEAEVVSTSKVAFKGSTEVIPTDKGASEGGAEIVPAAKGASKEGSKVMLTASCSKKTATSGGIPLKEATGKQAPPMEVPPAAPAPKRARVSKQPAAALPLGEKKKVSVELLSSAPDNEVPNADEITPQFAATSIVDDLLRTDRPSQTNFY